MNDISSYQQQLSEKVERLQTLFAGLDVPALSVFESAPEHYRMRAEFRIWHEGEDIFYAMFDPGRKASTASLQRITQFPPACERINATMPPLLAAMRADPVLRSRWYQVEFLATLSGELLVTLIYHRRLDDAWEAAARALQARLDIRIIGRSKGQKLVLSQDFVTERLHIDDLPHGVPRPFLYRQPEGAFTQPNARMCEQMIAWACRQVATHPPATTSHGDGRNTAAGASGARTDAPGSSRAASPSAASDEAAGAPHPSRDLLELYCGNGNFTLPLARYFRQVLATEISKTSVQAAQWNIEANGVDNVRIARLSSEEFVEAWEGRREFRRLKTQGIDLDAHDFSTVLVDPPRAGLDEGTLQLVSRFSRILYISCNPETLRANLGTLARTHDIAAMALFDQFPFTPHIESGVLLTRRAG